MGADSTDLPSAPPALPARTRAAGWVRLGAALLLAGWSLLTILEVPTDALWKPAIAATEWGHLLALVSLGVAVAPRWRTRPAKAGAALAVVAALLFASPLVRALGVADGLEARLTAAFGPARDDRVRSSPLSVFDLGLGRDPAPDRSEVGPRILVFTQRYKDDLELDLYLPNRRGSHRGEGPPPLPVVLVVHGGSWRGGDRTQLPQMCRYLAARGYAVASIDHRLAPGHPFPAALARVATRVARIPPGWTGVRCCPRSWPAGPGWREGR